MLKLYKSIYILHMKFKKSSFSVYLFYPELLVSVLASSASDSLKKKAPFASNYQSFNPKNESPDQPYTVLMLSQELSF